MAKSEKKDNKELSQDKSPKKAVKSSYSKKPNFYEIDGTLKIEEITAKIDAFLNV